MRKIWIVVCSVITLFGCTANGGKEWKLSSEDCIKKIENKDTFVLVVNQSSNQEGMIFQRTLEPFMREHKNLEIYEVILDEQGEKRQDIYLALNKITEAITSFEGKLPTMLYIEKGEVTKQIDGALSEVAWNNFLKECGLLKGEVEVEENKQLAESDMFKSDLNELYDEWQKGNEMYIFVNENDRYNIKFSETLKKQIEELKQPVYLMNVTDPNIYKDAKMQELFSSLTIYLTPTLLHIKDKAVEARLEDNASIEELKNWF